MKKIIFTLFLAALVLGMIGCGKDQSAEFVTKYRAKWEQLEQEQKNIQSQQQFMQFMGKVDSLYQAMKAELPSNAGVEAKSLVASIAFNLRKPNEAAQLYREILEQHPEIMADSVLLYASYAFLMVDSMDLARTYLEKSLENPDNADQKDQLAVFIIENELEKNGKDAAIELAESYKAKLGIAPQIDEKLKMLNLIGQPAQEIVDVMKWVNSKPLSLTKLKGKVVVIDFWATWCNPCRQSIPSLIELRNDLVKNQKRSDFEVIGLTKVYGTYSDGVQRVENVEPKKEAEMITDFTKSMKMDYPIAIASSNQNLDNYMVRGIPTFVIIDKTGIVRDVFVGFAPTTKEKMKEKVLQYLQ